MKKEHYIFQIYLINLAPGRSQVINMFSYLTDEAQREHSVCNISTCICNLHRIKKYQLNFFFISLLESSIIIQFSLQGITLNQNLAHEFSNSPLRFAIFQ